MYIISFYSQTRSERAAGSTLPTWGSETVRGIILGPKSGPRQTSQNLKPGPLTPSPKRLTSMPSWALASVSSFLIFLDLTLLYDLDANSFLPLQHCFRSVEDTAGQHFLLALLTSINHLSPLSPHLGTPTWCQACRVCPGPLVGVMDRRFLKVCCKSPGMSDSCHVRTLAIHVCVQVCMY